MNDHQGNKYHRRIVSVYGHGHETVDIYCVLEAFGVTCPARQHAIKKLLCCGNRGKGDAVDDLLGARDSIARALEMEHARIRMALADEELVVSEIADAGER